MKHKRLKWIFAFCMVLVTITHAQTLQTFPEKDISIQESPFYKAQQADLKYILEMDADRLLAPYLKESGLEPKADNYPNWENTGLDGHIGGHYVTALSLMYAATGNQEVFDRLNYMIDELEKCQKKNGNGYLSGVPDGKRIWGEIANGQINAGGFSLNKGWVPLYNIHKIFAALYDAYNIAGIEKTKGMLIALTDWWIETTKNLTDEQAQNMLRSEHGGLNEVFANVYELTDDKKYLDLARKFSHRYLLDPLLAKENNLTGMHANTQIPKVIGYKRVADLANDGEWNEASVFFWDLVVNKWTVSIGGNSVREHFHPADDFSSMVESNQGPETCNTYNMLKLSKMLYLSDPQSRYIDFYERAMYNHILSTEHPEKGGFVYFTPMRPRHYRVYSQPHECFWCCVGSGLENHGKYGELIYTHNNEELFVNLYISSELNWEEKDIKVIQQTTFPYEEKSVLKLEMKKSKKLAINFRLPGWMDKGKAKIEINGKESEIQINNPTFLTIDRKWSNGDKITVYLPMQTKVEYLPDGSNWASLVHGPIVLAAKTEQTDLDGLWADDSRMGHVADGPFYPIDEAPAIISVDKDFSSSVVPVSGQPMQFKIKDLIQSDKYKDITLEPFYNVHESRYMIYFPVYAENDFEAQNKIVKDQEEAMLALEAKTIDQVATGEQQPETEHNFKGEKTEAGINGEMYWRHAEEWFSYELKDLKKEAKKLRITYFGPDGGRTFNIEFNGEVLANVNMDNIKGSEYVDIDYDIPDSFTEKIKGGYHTVKFVAHKNSIAGGIYYIRLLR